MKIRTVCNTCNKLRKENPQIPRYGCKTHKDRQYLAVVWMGPIEKQKSKIFHTSKLAEDWIHEMKKKKTNGTYKKILPTTFNEIADKYLAEAKLRVRPAVYTHYKSRIELHLKPTLGNLKMKDITRDCLIKLMGKFENKSFESRKHLRARLKGVYKLAVMDGIVIKDLTTELPPLKNDNKKEYIILNSKQINSLLTLPYLTPQLKLYYKMSIYTGIRPNELTGLKVCEIDLDKKEIHIKRTLYWFKNKDEREGATGLYIFQKPKTLAGIRTIPIGNDLVKDIQIYLLEHWRENKEGLLFVNNDSQPLHTGNIRTRHWYDDRKAAELPELDMYELRHTFCSILMKECGIKDIKLIQTLMGHADFDTTANIYSHVMPQDTSHITEAFENYINNNSQNTHTYSNKQVQASLVKFKK